MPTGIRIDATPEQLDQVTFDHDGLVPAIAQDIDSREVLMMAWMNAESLRRTFDEGRMVYWSRSRQELWRKGDTSGDRQFVREAYYDCDGDTLAVPGRAGGCRGLSHRRPHVLLPVVRPRVRRRLVTP